MWRLIVLVVTCSAIAHANNSSPKTGDELVINVIDNCASIDCVKTNVLNYLDNILNIQSDNARSFDNKVQILILNNLIRQN